MCIVLIISVFCKILNFAGLCLDAWGVYKLFHLSPRQLQRIDRSEMRASFPPPDLNEFLTRKMDEMIANINKENKIIEKKSKNAFKLIIYGFALQISSIILSLIFNT